VFEAGAMVILSTATFERSPKSPDRSDAYTPSSADSHVVRSFLVRVPMQQRVLLERLTNTDGYGIQADLESAHPIAGRIK
jgi:hypothetical protein